MDRLAELELENADLRKQVESLNERLARLRATDCVFDLIHGRLAPEKRAAGLTVAGH